MQQQKQPEPSYETRSYDEWLAEKKQKEQKKISEAEFKDEYQSDKRKAERTLKKIGSTLHKAGTTAGNIAHKAHEGLKQVAASPEGQAVKQALINAGRNQAYAPSPLGAFAPASYKTITVGTTGTRKKSKEVKKQKKRHKPRNNRSRKGRSRHKGRKGHKAEVKRAVQAQPQATNVYIGGAQPQESTPPKYP